MQIRFFQRYFLATHCAWDPEATVHQKCSGTFLLKLLEHLLSPVALQGRHTDEEDRHTDGGKCELVQDCFLQNRDPSFAGERLVYPCVPLGEHRPHDARPHDGVPLHTGHVQGGHGSSSRYQICLAPGSVVADPLLRNLRSRVEAAVDEGIGQGWIVFHEGFNIRKADFHLTN